MAPVAQVYFLHCAGSLLGFWFHFPLAWFGKCMLSFSRGHSTVVGLTSNRVAFCAVSCSAVIHFFIHLQCEVLDPWQRSWIFTDTYPVQSSRPSTASTFRKKQKTVLTCMAAVYLFVVLLSNWHPSTLQSHCFLMSFKPILNCSFPYLFSSPWDFLKSSLSQGFRPCFSPVEITMWFFCISYTFVARRRLKVQVFVIRLYHRC